MCARYMDASYHIMYTGPAGWYYIYIYTAGGYNTTTPYTLRATCSGSQGMTLPPGEAWPPPTPGRALTPAPP